MEGNTGTTGPIALAPNRKEAIGDIIISPMDLKPLGGLNPYSPHFDRIGAQFARIIVEHARLRKDHHLLDIGCGTGRVAKPLIGLLEDGRYNGFDVNPKFINYCIENYKTRRAIFQCCDIQHEEFNRGGIIDPSTFEFPYPDKSFHIVIAIAVFNHFYASWVFQYIREIARVLKPGGVFIGTMQLLNRQSIEYISTRTVQPYLFPVRTSESWHDFEQRPLWNVAHPEEEIRRVFIKSNLMIQEPIRYGLWCGSPIALDGPDVIMAKKT